MNNSKSTEITSQVLEENEKEVALTDETTAMTNDVVTTVDNESVTELDDNESNSGNEQTAKESETIETKNEEEPFMKYIDKDFCYDLMSVPTVSNEEYRLVTYIILWARRNGIKYEFDEKGNIYLTKGELKDGEFYPCVTSHLDTVQTKQQGYAQAGCRLTVKTRINTKKQHEIFVDGMGIGGDDKAGVVICLSMFKHCEKLKAAFFLCEEKGCIGSNAMDVSKLDNVGYVMGFDSPELNRAAHTCSGVRLFSKDFFNTYLKDVCKEHGLDDFRSEPYTDVKVIRDKTNLMCMNFGTGYYNCHMPNEYCVLEEMDNACKMGIALVKKIGNTKHEYSFKSSYGHKDANGTFIYEKDDDAEFFEGLSKFNRSYYSGFYNNSTYKTNYSYTRTEKDKTPTYNSDYEKKDVNSETVKYVINRYESHISSIYKEIEDKCTELGIDFKEFSPAFSNKIKF